MMIGGRNPQPGEVANRENVSYLALALPREDLDELRRQGFVSREEREGGAYFRLRFRRRGRQVAIGLGTDPGLAQRVERELAQLQAERRDDRKQKHLIQATRNLLRRTKRDLESALHGAGYRFYGYEIRKLRVEGKEPSRPREAYQGIRPQATA